MQFRLIDIWRHLREGWPSITFDDVWAHLNTLYDMEALVRATHTAVHGAHSLAAGRQWPRTGGILGVCGGRGVGRRRRDANFRGPLGGPGGRGRGGHA